MEERQWQNRACGGVYRGAGVFVVSAWPKLGWRRRHMRVAAARAWKASVAPAAGRRYRAASYVKKRLAKIINGGMADEARRRVCAWHRASRRRRRWPAAAAADNGVDGALYSA